MMGVYVLQCIICVCFFVCCVAYVVSGLQETRSYGTSSILWAEITDRPIGGWLSHSSSEMSGRRRRSGHDAAAIQQPVDNLYRPGSKVRFRDYEYRRANGFSSFLHLHVGSSASPLEYWPEFWSPHAEHPETPTLEKQSLWSADTDYERAKRECHAEMPDLQLIQSYNHKACHRFGERKKAYIEKNRGWLKFALDRLASPKQAAESPQIFSPAQGWHRRARESRVRWRDSPGAQQQQQRQQQWRQDEQASAPQSPAERGGSPSSAACLILDACDSPLEQWWELVAQPEHLWLVPADYKRIVDELEANAAALRRGNSGKRLGAVFLSLVPCSLAEPPASPLRHPVGLSVTLTFR